METFIEIIRPLKRYFQCSYSIKLIENLEFETQNRKLTFVNLE